MRYLKGIDNLKLIFSWELLFLFCRRLEDLVILEVYFGFLRINNFVLIGLYENFGFCK